jgi:hypothetical protein
MSLEDSLELLVTTHSGLLPQTVRCRQRRGKWYESLWIDSEKRQSVIVKIPGSNVIDNGNFRAEKKLSRPGSNSPQEDLRHSYRFRWATDMTWTKVQLLGDAKNSAISSILRQLPNLIHATEPSRLPLKYSRKKCWQPKVTTISY